MRATISFETDVDQVEGTMAVVACAEEHNLRAAADILGNYTVLDGSLLDAITEVLRLLELSTDQLKQYQQMMVSFEKAKFETMLPQQAPATVPVQTQVVTEAAKNMEGLQTTLQAMSEFGSFVDRINNQAQEEEEADGLQTQEG